MCIACGYFLAFEISQALVFFFLWYSKTQPAMSKTKLFNYCYILVFFKNHVFAKNTYVGNLLLNILRYIIVTEEQKLNREISGSSFQDTDAIGEFNAAFFQEFF